MKDFQDHFHRAVQAAEGDSAIQQRLSAHWMELSQYFDSVEMMRTYYRKYLTVKSGRGLPKLIDEHIVMLVMCSELERARGCGPSGSSAQEASAMHKVTSQVSRLVSRYLISSQVTRQVTRFQFSCQKSMLA